MSDQNQHFTTTMKLFYTALFASMFSAPFALAGDCCEKGKGETKKETSSMVACDEKCKDKEKDACDEKCKDKEKEACDEKCKDKDKETL